MDLDPDAPTLEIPPPGGTSRSGDRGEFGPYPIGGDGSSDRLSDFSVMWPAPTAPPTAPYPPGPIILGIEEGGYLSEADIEFLLRLLLMYQAYQPPNIAAPRTATPTPAPIPALAPVDKPPPPPPPDPGCVDADCAEPAPAVVVYGDTYVLAAEDCTTYVVNVVRPTAPLAEVVSCTCVLVKVDEAKDTEEDVEVRTVSDVDSLELVLDATSLVTDRSLVEIVDAVSLVVDSLSELEDEDDDVIMEENVEITEAKAE